MFFSLYCSIELIYHNLYIHSVDDGDLSGFSFCVVLFCRIMSQAYLRMCFGILPGILLDVYLSNSIKLLGQRVRISILVDHINIYSTRALTVYTSNSSACLYNSKLI